MNTLHLLRHRFPNLEIWWDGLPWDIEHWKTNVIRDHAIEPVTVLSHTAQESIATGVTTNPRLIFESINRPSSFSNIWTSSKSTEDKDAFYWNVYKAIFAENAKMLLPMWINSIGRHGWISAQVPYFAYQSCETIEGLARELSGLAPNIMVKIPANQNGIQAIEALVSANISINATLVFTSSQVAACLRSIERGLAKRRATDKPQRNVITFMIGRFGRDNTLAREIGDQGARLTSAEVRIMECIAFEECLKLVENSHLPIDLLVSSVQFDVSEDKILESIHFRNILRHKVIVTLPEKSMSFLLNMPNLIIDSSDLIASSTKQCLQKKLMSIGQFVKMYEPDGIPEGEFSNIDAFKSAEKEALLGYQSTLSIIS